MSNILKDVKAYFVGNNKVLIESDHTDYTENAEQNKVLLRSRTSYPLEYNTYHVATRDGYSWISAVSSQDPLTLTTSGIDVDVSGYDGLVVSADGYQRYRGVVESYATSAAGYYGVCLWTFGDGVWFTGGYNSDIAEFNTGLWYSDDGANFDLIGVMPSYYTGSIYTNPVVDENGYVYLVSGTDLANPINTIIRGKMTLTEPGIQWNETLWSDGDISEYTRAAIDTEFKRIYVSEGFFDYTAPATLSTAQGTFDTLTHNTTSTYFMYEQYYRTLVISDSTGTRREYKFDPAGTLLLATSSGRVFVHRQTESDNMWSFVHNNGDLDYIVVCYTDDHLPLVHSSITRDSNRCDIAFDGSASGYCFLINNSVYHAANTTWTVSTCNYTSDQWYVCDSNLTPIMPSAWGNSGADMSVTFLQDTDGYSAVLPHYAGASFSNTESIYCRKALKSNTAASITHDLNDVYHGANSFWSFVSRFNMVVPNAVTYDIANGDVEFDLLQEESGMYQKSYYGRHDGYWESEQPWGYGPVAYGQSGSTPSGVGLVTGDGWFGYSSNYTEFTKTNPQGELPDTTSANIAANQPVFTGLLTDGSITRSVDSGYSWADYAIPATQEIAWYGRITPDLITTGFSVYFYPRPSDVVWESSWGHQSHQIYDYNDQVYRLLSPGKISAYSAGSITIPTDAAQVSIVRDELVGDWVHVIHASDFTTTRLQIKNNEAGGVGSAVVVFVDTADLTTNITTNDYAQIVVERDEGRNYYRFIDRDISSGYTVYYDGYQFPIDTQFDNCVYTNREYMQIPEHLSSREDFLRTYEAQLLSLGVTANTGPLDTDSLLPEQLEDLAKDYGAFVSNDLDGRMLRQLTKRWSEDVDAYGGCLDGINNIIKTILGNDTTVAASLVAASNSVGSILSIALSLEGEYGWNYTADYLPIYVQSANLYYMPVSTTDIGIDAREMIHYDLIHLKPKYISAPIPIFNQTYERITNKTRIWSDERLIEQYEVGVSKLVLLPHLPAQKIYTMIKNIQKYIPSWVTVQYT